MRSSPASEYPLLDIPVPYQYRIRNEDRNKQNHPTMLAAATASGTDAARDILVGPKVKRRRRESSHLVEEKENAKRVRMVDLVGGQKYNAASAVITTVESARHAKAAAGTNTPEPRDCIEAPSHQHIYGSNTRQMENNSEENEKKTREEEKEKLDEESDPEPELEPGPQHCHHMSKDILLSAAQQILGAASGATTSSTTSSVTTVAATGTTPSSIALGNETVLEETLPLSPLASPGVNTPDKEEGDELEVSATKDNVILSQIYMNELFSTVRTELPPICYKNLLFQLVSNMDRSELSDLSTLIRDNLKRDFIKSLPLEIALKILTNLPFGDIAHCLQASKSWNSLINSTPYLWKQMLISESFVSKEAFSKYSQRLKIKYPGIKTEEDGYQLDFLESCRVLQNWYNPKFIPRRTILRGHMTSVVTCLQFEDDYVITGADDKVIRVYDSEKKQFLLELTGHDGGVWALKYDEDGILVSGSTDRSVRVWDIKRGCCTHVFKGHTSTVRCLEIVEYKNVKYIVTGSRDNTLHVWKLPKESAGEDQEWPMVYNTPEENPYFVGVLRGHMASVRTVSGFGNIVISGSYDNSLMVWDIAQMKCLYILTGHTDRIYSTIYDYRRHRCISASMDTTIRVWDLQNIWNNGTCTVVTTSLSPCTKITGSMSTLQGHTALVGLLRLSDKFLVSAAADGSLRGWDSNDYSRKFAYHHSNLSAITTFYMSDNLLVSGSEGQFNVYNLRSGKLIHSNILRDADQIWSVNFKGRILVAAVEKDGQSYVELLDFGKPANAITTRPSIANNTVSNTSVTANTSAFV